MKKSIVALLFLVCGVVFAQEENQGQSIELPEFVITGKQNVNIQSMKKNKPNVISILSKEYLNPIVSPDQMSLSSISEPLDFKEIIFDDLDFVSGQLKIGIGLYTLPVGDFTYQYAKTNTILRADIKGINIRDYVENSDYNSTSIGAGIDWFNNNSASFLPGLRISANGNYIKNAYKFFASDDPTQKRETENINVDLSFSSFINKEVSYKIKAVGSDLKFKESDIKELNSKVDGLLKFGFSSMDIGISGFYQHQQLNSSTFSKDNYNSYGGKAVVGFEISKGLYFDVGATYAKHDTTDLIAPVGSLRFKINSNLTLVAEYSPYTEFLTNENFLEENKYFIMNGTNNVFTQYKNNISAALQYQFYKYFEINGGARYYKADQFVYYEDLNLKGMFEPLTADKVQVINVFGNFLFHNGPYGMFYGEIEFNSAKFENKKKIPYIPMIRTKLSYSFELKFGLRANVNLNYATKSYSDSINENEIPAYFDLGGFIGYKIFDSLEFTAEIQNILNKKNYNWLDYREKPFDVIVGINYTW